MAEMRLSLVASLERPRGINHQSQSMHSHHHTYCATTLVLAVLGSIADLERRLAHARHLEQLLLDAITALDFVQLYDIALFEIDALVVDA